MASPGARRWPAPARRQRRGWRRAAERCRRRAADDRRAVSGRGRVPETRSGRGPQAARATPSMVIQKSVATRDAAPTSRRDRRSGGDQRIQPALQHDQQDRDARQSPGAGRSRPRRVASRERPTAAPQRAQERGCSVAEMDDRLSVGARAARRAAAARWRRQTRRSRWSTRQRSRATGRWLPLAWRPWQTARSADARWRAAESWRASAGRLAPRQPRQGSRRRTARKSIAVARWRIAMPAGAPQRAAKPPIAPWTMTAPRRWPRPRCGRLLETPGVLNAVSAVASAAR